MPTFSLVERIAQYITEASHTEMISMGAYAVAIVMLTAIFFYILAITENQTKPPLIGEAMDLSEEEKEEILFQELFESKKSVTGGSGITSRYCWIQNEAELDLFIPIPKGTDVTDITVEIRTNSMKVSFSNTIVIDDLFYSAVKSDESVWQLDDWKGAKRLWCSLVKQKKAMSHEDYWKCVFTADDEE